MLLVISAILAQFIPSQTSIIIIMMTFMMSMGNTGEVTMSRMLLPITHVLTTWMGKFPVGAFGVTMYLMLNQFIEASGSDKLLDIFSILKCTFIPAVVSIIYCVMTYKWLPKRDVDTSLYEDQKRSSDTVKMSKRNEIITYISFIVSVLALIFTNQIGDKAYIVPLATVVVMIYLKAMDGKKFLRVLINGPVLMCATVIGIANAITASGAGEVIGNSILSVLGGDPSPILIIVTFAVVALIVTSFVSNTACFMVLVPIACNVCAVAGVDPRAVVVTIYYCSLLSLLTPMDSTGAALAYSSSGLGIRDTFKWAFPLAILGVAVTIINCLIVYPM